jgi:hypothetical protein
MDEATAASLVHTNLANPIRRYVCLFSLSVLRSLTHSFDRDTIGIEAGSYAIVRILADVPGVHAFHCHIVFHQVRSTFLSRPVVLMLTAPAHRR